MLAEFWRNLHDCYGDDAKSTANQNGIPERLLCTVILSGTDILCRQGGDGRKHRRRNKEKNTYFRFKVMPVLFCRIIIRETSTLTVWDKVVSRAAPAAPMWKKPINQ